MTDTYVRWPTEGGGSGTVTSVGLLDSTGFFNVTGSPVTTSGTLTLASFKSQAQNAVFIGPVSGGAGAPTFRVLQSADIPTLPYISTTLGATATSGGFTVSGNTLSASQSSATVNGWLSSTDWSTFNGKGSGTVTSVSVASSNGFTGTSSGGATPALTLATSITGILYGNGTSMAAAVAGNFPTLNQNTSGTAANITATSNATLTTLSALTTASALVTVGTIGTGVWQGTAVGATYGGTGISTASSTGIPSINSGTWSVSTTPTFTGTNISGTASSLTAGNINATSNSTLNTFSSSSGIEVSNGPFITTQFVSTQGYQISSPSSGGTVTTGGPSPGILLTPSATLATLTVKLPPSPVDGAQYWIATSQTITAITWEDSGGTAGNVIGGPSSLTSSGARFVYIGSKTTWYSIQ